ncbi:hypothetical protein ACFVIZ_00460 [Streptomyces anulatus]|uniref:hypothetical protein n=1 Tax=Streptomyces anulatus TaxID=1892 RepID=UPI0036437285
MNSPFRFLGHGPADEQPSVQPNPSDSPTMGAKSGDFEAARDAADSSSMNQQPEVGDPVTHDSDPYEGPALDSRSPASDGYADGDHVAVEDGHHPQEEAVPQDRDTLQRVLNHMASEKPQTPGAVVEPYERTPLGETQEDAPSLVPSPGPSESTGPAVQQSFGTNNGVAIGVQFQNIINGMRTVELRDDWVAQQLAVYVPPKNEKDAADKLRAEHVVVLLGESGAGRQPTGLRLLRGLSEELTLKRFHREPKDPFSLADLTGQQKVGWILDLRAEGDTVSGGLGFSFQDTTALKAATSYLVVLANPEVWESISDGGGNVAVTLKAPKAEDVLLAHLRAAKCRDPEEWAAHSRITQAIAGKLPGEAKQWSDAIMAEESRPVVATATASVNDRVDRVIEAMADWRNQLRTWHIEHPDSDHRNFLLAAASMDRTPVDLIYRASESLATTLGEKSKPRRGQQGPGIIELTYMIGAELTADGTVILPSDGYAEAVVEYFLMDRAHLVDRFTEWTATQAAKLKGDLGTQLADRVAVWVIRHTQKSRSVDVLKSVAGRWSNSKILRGHARDLLSVAAVDSEIGRLVRDGILAWARDDQVPERLLITLARVCQQVSQVYPKEALLRLGELAASDKPAVTAAVGEAFNAMWDRPEQRQRAREVLRKWARSPTESLRRSSSHAFLYLASRVEENGTPSLLSTENGYENDLPWIVQSWRTTLECDPAPDAAVDAFKAWLEGAASMPDARDAVFSVLARAVHDAPEDSSAVRFLGLNRLATHWEPSEPRKPLTDRARFRDSLVDWVRAADPTNPGTSSSVPKP